MASLLWALAVLDSPHTAAVAAYLMRYAAFLLRDARGKGKGKAGGTCMDGCTCMHACLASLAGVVASK